LVGALVLMMACAVFVPVSWLRWTNDLSAIVDVPVMPAKQLANTLQAWLRPAQSSLDFTGDAAETIELLNNEKEKFKTMYQRSVGEIENLREQLQQLQQLQELWPRTDVQYVVARLAGRSPVEAIGHVTLNRGSSSGITEGTVAVWGGAQLIGRVVEVDRLRSIMMPLVHPGNSELGAVIFPRDHAPESSVQATQTELRNQGNGSFEATVDHLLDIKVGDIVRLSDNGWPPSAQMLIIGEVEEVRPIDDNPLWRRLIVRPQFRAHNLPFVNLMLEDVETLEPAP
jgi:cell shape-determining protein MreC